MEELFTRTEAIDHLVHHGRKDPNYIIYTNYLNAGETKKAEAFLEYRRVWESVRKGEMTVDHPLFITLALNNSCNLSCAHCYRRYNPDSKTGKKSLTFDEITSIVDECKRIGVPSIGLGSESELLINAQVKEVIRYVSEKDFEDFWIYTNGILLTDEISDLILSSNVTRISISLDAITEETYQKTRGPYFFRVMSNVFHFLDKRNRKKNRLPIVRVSFVKYNLTEHEADLFIRFWSNLVEEVDIQPLFDIKNVNQLKYSDISAINCRYPNNMLYINWEGNYKPCCSEFCKYLTLGNIHTMSISEVWNSEQLNNLRLQLASKQPLNKFCLNCLRSFHSDEIYEPIS